MAAAVIKSSRKKEEARDEAIFKRYDEDGNGSIDKAELCAALRDMDLPHSTSDAERILDKHASNANTLSMNEWKHVLNELKRDVREKAEDNRRKQTEFLPYQRQVSAFYSWNPVQLVVASLILGNFVVNCVEKEIDPSPPQSMSETWEGFDEFFNYVFLVELLINMYGCGGPFRTFWWNGWNVFDFVVVVVGIIFMTGAIDPENPLSNLKMLRAFRVFRLFKRIKSLNKIVVALLRSLPGVFNAFVIMVIFMMIYAILAVEYFSPLGQSFGEHPYGTYVTYGDDGVNHTISAETPRGFVYGWEYYGTFTRAMFTLFQVMTGESWSEAVARPLMFGLYRNAFTVTIYFVSFILLMQVVLTNVVVAVLLDKFVTDDAEDDAAGDDEQASTDEVAAPMSGSASLGSIDVASMSADGDGIASADGMASSAGEKPIASGSDVAIGDLDRKISLILSELVTLRKDVDAIRAAQPHDDVTVQ